MDSASVCCYPQAMACVSCLRPPSHNSQHLGSSSRGARKPTFNQNSIQQCGNLRRYTISCSSDATFYHATLPTFQSSKKFRIFRSEGRRALIKVCALKGRRGFGPLPEKKNSTQNEGTPNGKEFEVVLNNNVQSVDDDDDDEIPEIVFNRIISRILFYVGVSIGLGFIFLYFLNFLKMELKWDVPLWLTGLTTLITFGSSALGITYGIVSASWDPLNEGSVLGMSEAKRNWPMVWDSGQGNEEE